jgi:hypothetical protein
MSIFVIPFLWNYGGYISLVDFVSSPKLLKLDLEVPLLKGDLGGFRSINAAIFATSHLICHPPMQLLKIIITLIVLIALGIIVGSNLIPTMTVTFLSQPTISLPIGLWVAIAIGLGLLSSSIFQFCIFLERRLLDRKIRQLQARSKQNEDIFTYTPEPSRVDYREERVAREPVESTDPPPPKKSIFSSYRANFADRFKSPPAPKRIVVDDDWDAPPVSNRQLEWDEPAPARQQQTSERSYAEPVRRDEVYDADFRLIQPPYKEPVDRADYSEPEEDDDDDEPDEPQYSDYSSPASSSTSRDTASKQSEDNEDWGFDFDEEDARNQNPRSKNRKF